MYLIDLGKVMQLIDCVVLIEHSMCNSKKTSVSGNPECTVQILRLRIRLETRVAWVHLTDSLLQALLECTPNSHDLSHRFHCRPYFAIYVRGELREIPLRNLGHDVVQRRFEAGGGRFRNGIGELWKRPTKGNLGSSVSKRVSSGFRCKSTEYSRYQ